MILDPLIGGIAMGCIYSLIALGYNMLIRAMNLLHFAQGEVMMVGALAGVTLVSVLHIPYLAAIPLIMALCAALSLGLDTFAYRPVRRRNVPVINLIIATLGVSILLSNAAILIWGAEPIRYPRIYGSDALLLGPVRIPPQFLAPLVVGGLLMVGGILFGVIETFGALFISSGYKDALGYAVMIAILLVAPSGLFGRRARA